MKWLRKAGIRFIVGQKGFTLLEVLIAVAILAAIGVVLLQGVGTFSGSYRISEEKAIAGNLAADYLEAIKGIVYADTYPNAGDNIVRPFQYDVAVNISFYDGYTSWVDPSTGLRHEEIVWVDNYTDQTLQKITVSVLREDRSILTICTLRMKR